MIRSVCNNDSIIESGSEHGQPQHPQQQEDGQETLEQHIFRSFTDRQSVLQIICNVYEALTGKEFSNADSDDKRYNIVDAIQDENTFATPLRKIIPRKSQDTRPRRENGAVNNGLVDLDRSVIRDGLLLESTALEPSGDGTVDFHEALSSPPRSRCSTLDESFLHRGHGTDDTRVLESLQIHWNASKDTKKEWERVRKESCTAYTEIAVERKILPISLNRFFELFLADDAIKSMSFFQGNIIQDDDVECTCWKISNSNSALMDGYKEYTRQITSKHNRNARVGPKIVPLDRRQTLRRYSNLGIVINTVLNMEGVPYGDMFEMQDEWIIESCNLSEIAFSVRFKIHFTKRPMAMIRKVIRDQSRKEITTWFKMYMEMIQETLGGEMEVCPNTISLKDRIRATILLCVQCVVGLFSSRLFSITCHCILVYCYIRVFDRIKTLESTLHYIQFQNDHIMEKIDAVLALEHLQQNNWSQCFGDFLHQEEIPY
jgi:hypothetical protein